MTPRTQQFTRQQLLAHARKVHAGHASIANICVHREDLGKSTALERDMVEAIVAVLESYPLARPAAESVRIIFEDLAQRGGFREVLAGMGPVEVKNLTDFLASLLERTVVYAPPATAPEPESYSVEMDFGEPKLAHSESPSVSLDFSP